MLAIAICVSLSSGCTSLMQKNAFNSFDEKVTKGDYQKASEYALDKADYDAEKRTTDDLLWSLQAGATLSFAGNHKLSTEILDISEKMMKSEDQENVVVKGAETFGSIIGNDAMLDYEQTHYDGIMANTYKAWNFIFDGKYNDARVELNRAEERQRRAAENFAKKIKAKEKELKAEAGDSKVQVNKSLESKEMDTKLASVGIQQNLWKPYEGYVNPFTTYSYALNLMVNGKDRSDYQKAAKSFERVYAITNSKTAKMDMQLARDLSRGKNKNNKYVWIILENGQSIAKEEIRVDLPIFLLDDNVSYAGIALPKLKERDAGFENIEVGKHKTEKLADINQIIGAEFDTEFPYILAREITRATVKTIAQKQIRDADSTMGDIFAIGQLLTTGADIRSFTALPKEFQVTRVRKDANNLQITAGAHKIPVSLDSKAKNHIVYVKAVNPLVAPTVKVVNI